MNIFYDPEGYAELLYADDFVILDTETTGIEEPEACEISIIDKNGKVLLDTLIKPSKPVEQGAYEIHGISNEMLQNAPSWPEIQDKFIEAVTGKTVLIYNSAFDVEVIENTMRASGADTVPYKTECVMELFADYHGDYNEFHGSNTWKPLTFAAENFGIESEGAHRAKADCLMTLGVLKGMAGKLEPEEKPKQRTRRRP